LVRVDVPLELLTVEGAVAHQANLDATVRW
jgi:hypothetical protein